MTVVAADSSKDCCLDVYPDSFWVGVVTKVSVWCSPVTRLGKRQNPEGDEGLKRLEERLVKLKFVNTPELDVLFSGSRWDGHATQPTNSENRGSHSSWVGGGWGESAPIDSSRDGRFDKRRAERLCGEDHQAVLLFPLLVDVQSRSEVKDGLVKLKLDENKGGHA